MGMVKLEANEAESPGMKDHASECVSFELFEMVVSVVLVTLMPLPVTYTESFPSLLTLS